MGKGSSKLKSAGAAGQGVSSEDYFRKDLQDQTAYFESGLPEELVGAFRNYTIMGMGDEKAVYDDKYGISDFIDSEAADRLRVSDNPVLYRGGTISDEEFKNLQVGGDLTALNSDDQFTSWSTREVVAHMYAEDSKNVWGSKSNSHDIVIIDESRTSDGIALPYTYPHNEVVRSRNTRYTITRIADASEYTAPIGRNTRQDAGNDYYTKPVTYVYVNSYRRRK